jgi:excisionase family DNA binding protein
MAHDLTTGQIAEGLGVAPRTVVHWIDEGLLPGYRIPGSRHRRVRPVECLEFLKEHQLPQEWLQVLATPAAGDQSGV